MAHLPPPTPLLASSPAWRGPRLPSRRTGGFSLVETMVAIGIIGIALLGMVGGISDLKNENRATSQRMLAASVSTEMLELVKALSAQNVRNSTTASPVYLKTTAAGTPNLAWRVPQVGEFLPLPVEDVLSTSGSDPTLVANKLPQATWNAVFTPDAANAKLIYVTVNLRWQLNPQNTRRPLQYTLNTAVSSDFARL